MNAFGRFCPSARKYSLIDGNRAIDWPAGRPGVLRQRRTRRGIHRPYFGLRIQGKPRTLPVAGNADSRFFASNDVVRGPGSLMASQINQPC